MQIYYALCMWLWLLLMLPLYDNKIICHKAQKQKEKKVQTHTYLNTHILATHTYQCVYLPAQLCVPLASCCTNAKIPQKEGKKKGGAPNKSKHRNSKATQFV